MMFKQTNKQTNKQKLALAFSCVLMTQVSFSATAGVIRFDDAWFPSGETGQQDLSAYKISDGLTITGDHAGIWGGNENGDPGNWNLVGTNGSAFLGANDFDYAATG